MFDPTFADHGILTIDAEFPGDPSILQIEQRRNWPSSTTSSELLPISHAIMLMARLIPPSAPMVRPQSIHKPRLHLSSIARARGPISWSRPTTRSSLSPPVFRMTPAIDSRRSLASTNGSIDSSFGDEGVARVPTRETFDPPIAVALDSQQRILLVDTNDQVIRLDPSGALDTSFDHDGIVTLGQGVPSAGTSALDIQTIANRSFGQDFFRHPEECCVSLPVCRWRGQQNDIHRRHQRK